MKLLNRLRDEFEFNTQSSLENTKQENSRKPSQAALALLPKANPVSLLKESLR
ncbi:MAG: hypothetical protein SOX43_05875 [Pelistega sp.]|nr:hypothetical protein [Pelistega sp.]